MDRTIFTDRLRIERTSAAPGNGISKELPTLRAEPLIGPVKAKQPGIIADEFACRRIMLRFTPAGDKERQQAKILQFFAAQLRWHILIFHVATIHHPGRALN
jgi:hypothetical protein